MSPLATVIIAWAAVYAYVCAYYCTLYARRRTERVYLSFGLLAGALAVFAVGAALLTDARTAEEAALGMRLKLIGLAPGIAFSVDFCHQLVGRTRSRAMVAAYAVAAAGLVAAATGLTVDASELAPRPTWGFDWAPDYAEPSLTAVGHVMVIIAWGFIAYALLLLFPHARQDRDARLIAWSFVANATCGAHDIFVHIGSLRSVYLLEHGAMLSIVAMSYLLLDRFVRTSEQLSSRTLELRSSYDELRHTQQELVQKEQLAAVGELSAVIAHEVRNPLAIIKNSVSGLRRPQLGAGDRETLLSILDEEVDRLNRLVNDLLAYARPVTPQAREIPLEDLIDRAVDLARRGNGRAAAVEVEVDVAGGVESLFGDPDLLRHAFVNIVENALQAMTSGGTLSVCARQATLGAGRAVRVDFRDTGEGMDNTVRSKALDPFFTTRPTGTGLGLAIVERVVRTHGGQIEIDSRSGRGTTVSVLLPVDRTSADPDLVASPVGASA